MPTYLGHSDAPAGSLQHKRKENAMPKKKEQKRKSKKALDKAQVNQMNEMANPNEFHKKMMEAKKKKRKKK